MPKPSEFSLARRMKNYEAAAAQRLPRRVPVILRLDGWKFRALARKRYGAIWSPQFFEILAQTARTVAQEIGCPFAYVGDDEMNFLLTDYRTIRTKAWLGYDARKMISIAASLAGAFFSRLLGEDACFEGTAFSLPQDDICNYFLWRQNVAQRNAVRLAGNEFFSRSQLKKKNNAEINAMLLEQGVDFAKLPTGRRRGICLVKGRIDLDIPLFSEKHDYVDRRVFCRKD